MAVSTDPVMAGTLPAVTEEWKRDYLTAACHD